MSLLAVAGANSAVAGGYDIDNSLKLEEDNTEYLSRTNASAGNSKTFTFSGWYKFTEINTLDGNALFEVTGGAPLKHFSIYTYDYRIGFYDYLGGVDYGKRAAQVCRDTSAWYHIHVQIDTTEATASDRSKFYINGVRVTEFDRDHGDFPLNFDTQANKVNEVNRIGRTEHMNGQYLNGYVAEVHMVDGQALPPTDFGEFDADTGIWKPIETSVSSYGTNGFYLKFDNSSDLGEDASGGSSFTLTNVTSADQATDTPTNNFCTFNPLMIQNNPPTISEGAMKSTGGGGTWNQTWGNIGVKNGKWYYEFKVANSASTGYFGASTTPAEGSSTAAASLMYNTSFMVGGAARIDYSYWQNGSQVANESTGWGTISTNDIIGIALDLDSATKTFTVYKNGTALSGTLSQPVDLPTNMQDEFIFPLYVQYENRQDEANFGGYTISTISSAETDANGYGTFEYAPPTGYYALCSKNLAEYG